MNGIVKRRGGLMPGRRRRSAGFTLIELMIVITIIFILVGIAAARYDRSVQRAKEATLKTEATEWFSARKRRKTNNAAGRRPGAMPGFRRKDSDQRFVCWFNAGRNAVFTATGRRYDHSADPHHWDPEMISRIHLGEQQADRSDQTPILAA